VLGQAHPTGHFISGCHAYGGLCYEFTRESFRLFATRDTTTIPAAKRPGAAAAFVDRIYYVTVRKPLVDVDSKTMQGMVISKLAGAMAGAIDALADLVSIHILQTDLMIRSVTIDEDTEDSRLGARIVTEQFGTTRQARAWQALQLAEGASGFGGVAEDAVGSSVAFWHVDDPPGAMDDPADDPRSEGGVGTTVCVRRVERCYHQLLVRESTTVQSQHKTRMGVLAQHLTAERLLVAVLNVVGLDNDKKAAGSASVGTDSIAERAAARYLRGWRLGVAEAQENQRWLPSEVLELFSELSVDCGANICFT
jgi:hypothetical protein